MRWCFQAEIEIVFILRCAGSVARGIVIPTPRQSPIIPEINHLAAGYLMPRLTLCYNDTAPVPSAHRSLTTSGSFGYFRYGARFRFPYRAPVSSSPFGGKLRQRKDLRGDERVTNGHHPVGLPLISIS